MSNSQPAEDNKQAQTNQARKTTYYIFAAVLCIWLYTLWADRVTPMTNEGRVNGQIIRLSPQVSGPIAKVEVRDNEQVKTGQPLIVIDPRPFQLDVTAAKLALQQATQSFNADSTAIEAAKAAEVAARVKLENTRLTNERNRALARTGVVSKSTLDDSNAALETAQANLAQATASLLKAKEALGPEGTNNPAIQSALNKLDQATLNLSYTELHAPMNGVVTNMKLAPGNYAAAGQPLITFINNSQLWMTAMVTENSLAYIDEGTAVKIVFDAYPGEVFKGEVTSIGWGTGGNGSLTEDASLGLLDSPTSDPKSQRFPVNITYIDLPDDVKLRFSGRATVSFYPGESYVGERLLDVWTWIWSYLSYVA
ncbi:HlyD family secretion protein [Enterovibrio paralichthyis]|uniref:HlyD family secretion protein n=1 Tax=Enterovibrio paralichthyis TaxID=2853805 RepID=UPI0006D098DD|nr:HlyD family secretion protein [Enterovibrio paralichthyis]